MVVLDVNVVVVILVVFLKNLWIDIVFVVLLVFWLIIFIVLFGVRMVFDI